MLLFPLSILELFRAGMEEVDVPVSPPLLLGHSPSPCVGRQGTYSWAKRKTCSFCCAWMAGHIGWQCAAMAGQSARRADCDGCSKFSLCVRKWTPSALQWLGEVLAARAGMAGQSARRARCNVWTGGLRCMRAVMAGHGARRAHALARGILTCCDE